MLKKIILGIFLYQSCLLNAQVIHINELDSLWRFKISATGLHIKGNSPKTLLTNKLKITKVNKNIGLICDYTYQYGTASAKKIVVYNDFRFENTILLKPKNRFNPFVRTFTEKNIIRNIVFRHEVALGALQKVISRKEHRLNFLLACVNQQTNYKTASLNIAQYSSSKNLNTWKVMAGISGFNSLVKNKLRAEYRFYWMQAFENKQNFAYLIDITLEFILNNQISLLANYSKTYEYLEPKGILPYEVQLTYGLSIKF